MAILRDQRRSSGRNINNIPLGEDTIMRFIMAVLFVVSLPAMVAAQDRDPKLPSDRQPETRADRELPTWGRPVAPGERGLYAELEARFPHLGCSDFAAVKGRRVFVEPFTFNDGGNSTDIMAALTDLVLALGGRLVTNGDSAEMVVTSSASVNLSRAARREEGFRNAQRPLRRMSLADFLFPSRQSGYVSVETWNMVASLDIKFVLRAGSEVVYRASSRIDRRDVRLADSDLYEVWGRFWGPSRSSSTRFETPEAAMRQAALALAFSELSASTIGAVREVRPVETHPVPVERVISTMEFIVLVDDADRCLRVGQAVKITRALGADGQDRYMAATGVVSDITGRVVTIKVTGLKDPAVPVKSRQKETERPFFLEVPTP